MFIRLFRAAAFACAGALLLQQSATGVGAESAPADSLRFFKNYFITGDYLVAGTGLDVKGVNGVATGAIDISGVPEGVDIVAAFLYWQAVVNDDALGPDAGSASATFRGRPLRSAEGPFAKQLGAGTSPCWSGGGATGGGGGKRTYTYRSDVLRHFAIDETSQKFSINGSHPVQIPDMEGVNALGASLVVVYRDSTLPLRAIVVYDGAHAMNQATPFMSQQIRGFYQSTGTAGKLTHIVGSGQENKSEFLLFNGRPIATNPFKSALGSAWDNPTFPVTAPENSSAVTTSVGTTDGTTQLSTFDCLTWSAVVYRTDVKDTDGDGLLDVWESATTPLVDPEGRQLPLLSAMGADPAKKDLYMEVGYMAAPELPYGGVTKPAHSHMPTHETLRLVGDAFKKGGISVHFDVGAATEAQYPAGDPLDASKNADEYIIRGAAARGGEGIHEMVTVCEPAAGAAPWACQFKAHPGTVGWKTGFQLMRDEILSISPQPTGADLDKEVEELCSTPGYTCTRRFDRERKDMFRYVLFAHAIGIPTSEHPCLDANGAPSGTGADGLCAVASNPDFHTPRTNTGVADFPGGDAMITLGAFPDAHGLPVGTPFMQASTLMHEFGHNAERRHGGEAFEPNCKPTYLSVMNYLYQLRGLLDDNGKPHLDFSGSTGNEVDETRLSDGYFPDWTPSYRIGWYAPLAGSYLAGRSAPAKRHCNGTPADGSEPSVRIDSRTAAGAIDWNANGDWTDAGFPLDINFSGNTFNFDGSAQKLRSSNDWAALVLNQTGSRRNTGGLYVLDTAGRLALGPMSLSTGRGDLGRGDLGRGDLGRGDLGRGDLGRGDLGRGDLGTGDLGRGDLGRGDLGTYDFGRGDLGRGDLGRGDLGRGDLGRGDLGTLALGRGDLGRGDLGGGDLFLNDPNNPSGELDYTMAEDLARTPPNEFQACIVGVSCPVPPAGARQHSVMLEWKSPNIGNVGTYVVYRVAGADLTPNASWAPVGQVSAVLGQVSYSIVDSTELVHDAQYTYFAVAVYADGVQSDASNLRTIRAVNLPPVATGDSFTTSEDTVLDVAAPGVLVNDSDADSAATLTAVLVSGPSNGTVSLNANGSFRYTPAANFNGTDAFTYKAVSGSTASGVATVDITVHAVNDAPVALADSYVTPQGKALAVVAPGVLGNDSDLEGPLGAVLVSGPANGVLALQSSGAFTYTPATGFVGTDSFVYGASDGAAVAPATVTITVTGQTYGFIGVQNLPPPTGKAFKVGSSVPLQWQFTMNGVVFNSANARPQIIVVSGSGQAIYSGTPLDPGSSSFQAPTAANGFTWQFNLQTKGLAPGTYHVFVGSMTSGQTYSNGTAFGPYPIVLTR